MNFNGKQITKTEFSSFLNQQIELRSALKKIKDEDFFNLELQTFIKYCFVTFTPNESGIKIVKYLANTFKFHEISAKECKGDFFWNFKIPIGPKYVEGKVSYLSKVGSFGIRNIRAWHGIDFYLLCFIPSPMELPYFFLVELSDLKDKYTLTHMNGTAKENKENKNSGQGLTIAYTEENINYLSSISLLNGHSYNDLVNYLEENTFIPYGFNGTKIQIQDSVEKLVAPKTKKIKKKKIKKGVTKQIHTHTNLKGFRINNDYYNLYDDFTKNYVEFITTLLTSPRFLHHRFEVKAILARTLVSDVRDFPPTTMNRPSVIKQIGHNLFLSTYNGSVQKKEIITKIAKVLNMECQFFSNNSGASNLFSFAR